MGKGQSKIDEKTIKGKRKPGTLEGSWDGACTMWKSSSGHHTVMMMNDSNDCKTQIVDDKTVEELSKALGEERWVRMTREDIRKTAGI